MYIWHFPDCQGSHTNRPDLILLSTSLNGARGSTVAKVLCYKSEGRWLDPSWCHWNFLLT